MRPMRIQRHAVVLAALSISLVLLTSLVGVRSLWRSMVIYHSHHLSEQIRTTLYNEISEGNLFSVTAALGRLRMSGVLTEAALFQIQGERLEWLYVSSDEIMKSSVGGNELAALCKDQTANVQLSPEDRLTTVIRLPVSGAGVTCVVSESVIPLQLTNVRRSFFVVLAAIVFIVIAGMAILLVRISRQELRVQTLAAEQRHRLTKALADQAWQVAHDIRSPLAAINLAVRTSSEMTDENLQVIKSAANRIQVIAADLVRQAKVSQSAGQSSHANQNENLSSELEYVIVAELAEEIWKEKKVEFSSRPGLEIAFDWSGSKNAVCKLDKKEFSRVLSNLINNSVEAIQDNKGKVKLALRQAEDELAVIVSDSGRGIPKDVLEKLGDSRVTYGKDGESGSGIGVLHAKCAIQSMGGRFQIQSRVGMGTLVTLTLPVSQC